MSEAEKLELFNRLEPWARQIARLVAVRVGLKRWADDIEQDVALALWEAVGRWNGNGSADGFIKQRVQQRIKNALKRYGRWDERERTGLLDDVLQDE